MWRGRVVGAGVVHLSAEWGRDDGESADGASGWAGGDFGGGGGDSGLVMRRRSRVRWKWTGRSMGLTVSGQGFGSVCEPGFSGGD